MFGKPRDSESNHPVSETAGPAPERPLFTGYRRRKALLFLGLACILAAGYRYYDHWRNPPLPVPVPADWSQLEPQVAGYLQQLAAYAEADKRDPTRHATLGLGYAANGVWNLAELAFSNAARLAPNDPLPWLYMAISQEQGGEKTKALATYLSVTQRFPDFAPGFQRLGEAALQTGDLAQAAKAFERVTALATNEWHGLAGLGEVRLRQQRFAEAITLLKQALQRAPAAGSAHHLLAVAYQTTGRTNEAAKELRLGFNPTRFPMADAWSSELPRHMRRLRDVASLAQSLITAGQPQQAIALLQSVLAFDTNNVPLLVNLGIAHNQAGQPDQARGLLERALRLDHTNAPAMVALSASLLALGDVTNAQHWADQAVAAAPTLPQPYLARANTALALTNSTEAITDLERAFERAPSSGQILMDIGNVLFLNEGDVKGALERYERAVEVQPALVPAHVRIAQIHLRQGETNAALKALRVARQYAPGDTNLALFEQAIQHPQSIISNLIAGAATNTVATNAVPTNAAPAVPAPR